MYETESLRPYYILHRMSAFDTAPKARANGEGGLSSDCVSEGMCASPRGVICALQLSVSSPSFVVKVRDNGDGIRHSRALSADG